MATVVRDLLRGVIAEEAPEELPLVEGMAELDDTQVARIYSRRARAREPLGYGLETAVAMVVPVLWLVLTEVARNIAGTTVDRVSARVRQEWWRRLTRRGTGTPPAVIPPLTQDQIADVRRKVRERSLAAGIDEDRATALADAVAVRLALDTGDEEEERDEEEPGAG
jgi:hypothetical protein